MRLPSLELAMLLAVACGGAVEQPASAPAPKPEAPAAAPAAPKPDPAPVPERGGGPAVKLLDAGKPPRATLRYAPEAAQRETLNMVMRMKLGIGKPELPGEPRALPGTIMRVNVTVDSVQPNGDIVYHYELASVQVAADTAPAEAVAQLNEATRKLVGLGGRGTLTSRGLAKQMRAELPSGENPLIKELVTELERSMRDMCDPLPEEAVGVGARWDVHTRHSLRGVEIDQVRRYTLLERSASGAKLKFIVEQEARPQPMRLPNLPAGAKVELVQLASAGDGSVEREIARLIPRSSRLGLRTTSVVSVTAKGRKETVRTDMEMDVEMSGAEGRK